MRLAKPFRFMGICTSCDRRDCYLNADGLCYLCSERASKGDSSVVSTASVDAALVPRRGWDIGVCIRCGFIKTCQDSVCRECREQL
jgi:hypothetical protein